MSTMLVFIQSASLDALLLSLIVRTPLSIPRRLLVGTLYLVPEALLTVTVRTLLSPQSMNVANSTQTKLAPLVLSLSRR
jgi:hypothetical protein